MPKRSERYANAVKAAEAPVKVPLEPRDAIEAVKKAASVKFDETVDVAVNPRWCAARRRCPLEQAKSAR